MSEINAANSITMTHELVYTLKVRDAMRRDVLTVTPENTLREVQIMLREHRISGTPVLEHDQLVGIVSIEDIINALDRGHIEERVGKWMTRRVITIQENMPLRRAVDVFQHYHFGRIPVTDSNGKLCGIVTSEDIVVRLMLELSSMAEDATRRENERLATGDAPAEDGSEMTMEFPVRTGDFDNAGIASARIKAALKERGVDIKVIRRAAIATYEVETNVIIHSIGGKVTVKINNDRIRIEATDWGPGIPDVEQALIPGFSTASELVRTLGFGAGMGLPNIRKCSDRFQINSQPGVGTTVEFEIDLHLNQEETGQTEVSDATQPGC
ncbi:MAG TPA: CBS domain-containing protein [Armatimonadota bacterium]|nr:CBS domain-containing protein [Armatimonadota bacterium]